MHLVKKKQKHLYKDNFYSTENGIGKTDHLQIHDGHSPNITLNGYLK